MARAFRTLLIASCVLIACAAAVARAQEERELGRSDGAAVAVRVYGDEGASCRGVAVLSPGAGGSERGLRYLAESFGRDRWLAVVAGHRESGPDALRADLRGHGLRDALRELTTNRSAYVARAMDLGAALAWARPRCGGHFAALLGHSMGAATVMLEAGARNRLELAGEDRFDAYVALSPQGPGEIFPEHAWRAIGKPMLMLTGTRDQALEGSWETRTVAYDDMPAGCKWIGVIDGATHMNLGGNGYSPKAQALASGAARAFLDAAAAGTCGVLPIEGGITYRHK